MNQTLFRVLSAPAALTTTSSCVPHELVVRFLPLHMKSQNKESKGGRRCTQRGKGLYAAG